MTDAINKISELLRRKRQAEREYKEACLELDACILAASVEQQPSERPAELPKRVRKYLEG